MVRFDPFARTRTGTTLRKSRPTSVLQAAALPAEFARLRLGVDHIAELPHGDLAAEADERVECRIGATHLEAR